jgi:hypothetical protein
MRSEREYMISLILVIVLEYLGYMLLVGDVNIARVGEKTYVWRRALPDFT